MLTLEDAKLTNCCRICKVLIIEPGTSGRPEGWKEQFGSMLYPLNVTLNFGREFAHTKCLNDNELVETKDS